MRFSSQNVTQFCTTCVLHVRPLSRLIILIARLQIRQKSHSKLEKLRKFVLAPPKILENKSLYCYYYAEQEKEIQEDQKSDGKINILI
jgi:hypothetical protein